MSVTAAPPRPTAPLSGGCRRRRGAGFTLVEVLVAVVVLSIGLLGVGKMVLYSARANGSAYMRSEASEQAYAVLDYMRANRTVALTHNYDVGLGAPPAAGTDCFAGPCITPSAIASYDVQQWKAQLALLLPAGDGTITTVTDPVTQQTMVTVVVQWDDTVAQASFKAAAPGTPMKVSLESQL